MRRTIRKKLVEYKSKKETITEKKQLLYKRLKPIFEINGRLVNVNKLSESEKFRLFKRLVSEINDLHYGNLIMEEDEEKGVFWDVLKKIFGTATDSLLQTLAEPMVDKLMDYLELSGLLRESIKSYLLRNPLKILDIFRGCKKFTVVISAALAEGVISMLMKDVGLQGLGYTALRNAMLDQLKSTKFAGDLATNIEGPVCELYNKFLGRAKETAVKLTGTEGTKNVAPAT